MSWWCRLVGVVGVLAAAGAVISGSAADLSPWSGLPAVPSAATGILYLALANGLARRHRTAWNGLVALLVGNAGLVILAAPDGVGWWRAAVAAPLLAVVIVARTDLVAGPPRRRPWRALLLSAGVLLAGPVLTWSLLSAFSPDTAAGRQRVLCSAAYALQLLFPTGPPDVPVDPPAWILSTTGVLGVVTLLAAVALWYRPVRRTPARTPADDERLRALLAAHGERDSLGYFALRDDKTAIFSRSGKAAVCYRVAAGVSLASGDPIGDPEAWPEAIAAWRDDACQQGLVPGVLGAGELGAKAYARQGLRVLEMGDEAIVELADFSLDGRPMRAVRQAANRVRRAGYQVRMFRVGDVPQRTVAELITSAVQWRDGGTERGFSMALGRFGDPADLQYVVLEARDADGVLRAVLGFVPWGPGGLSLDLMRRDPDSDNGLFEFMIVDLLTGAGRALGVRRVSLNFVMFQSAFARGERLGAGPVLRSWRGLLRLASRWWQLESLYRATLKYRPGWEPRYVCYPRRGLLRVGLAAAVAEGFITAPGGRDRVSTPARPRVPVPAAALVQLDAAPVGAGRA